MNVINQEFGQNWALYHGDSAIVTKGIPDNSIGLTIKSPPFPGMYTYTNSPHDMGNVQSIDEMIDQYEFLQREILRATMPGRNNFMHITQGVAQSLDHMFLADHLVKGMRAVTPIKGGRFTHQGRKPV